MYKFNIVTKEYGSKFIWEHSERQALEKYFDWVKSLNLNSSDFEYVIVRRIQRRVKFYNVKLPISKAKMKRIKNQIKKEKRKGA